MVRSLALFAIVLCASASAASASAERFPGATGMLPLPQDVGPGDKPEPSKVTVQYDPQRDRYCVSPERAHTGSRIARTVCRSATAWNKSGELVFPVG